MAGLGALDGVERVERVAAATGAGWPRRANCGPGCTCSGRRRAMVAPVAALVASHRAQLTDVAIGAPSLEDVFIALTGRALR